MTDVTNAGLHEGYPLPQTADLIRYIETGHVKGKVAIHVVEASKEFEQQSAP